MEHQDEEYIPDFDDGPPPFDDDDDDPTPPKHTLSDWLRLLGNVADLSAEDADALFEVMREKIDDLSVPF
jgi:hypothetical protein